MKKQIMSNRSLRGSTKNSRMATASAIAQQSLTRALAATSMSTARGSNAHRRRSSQSSNAGDFVGYHANNRMGVNDVDNDSSVYSHSSLYSDEFASEPAAHLTSCLVAPNKNVRVNGDAEPLTSPQKKQKSTSTARSQPQPNSRQSSAIRSNNSSSANSPAGSSISSAPRHRHVTNMNAAAMQIDDAVVNAYRKVRFERDAQRKKLIQRVLTESRDRVICEALKKRSLGSNKYEVEISTINDGSKKRKVFETSNTSHSEKEAKKLDDSVGPSKSDDFEIEKGMKRNYLIPNPAVDAKFIFPRLPSNDDGIGAFFATPFCMPCNDRSIDDLPSATSANAMGSKAKMPSSSVAQSTKLALTLESGNRTIACARSDSSSSDDVMSIDDNEVATLDNPAVRHTTNANIHNINNVSKNSNHAITIKTRIPNYRGSKTISKYQPILIEGTHAPRPLSSSCIFLKSHFAVEDERNLAYIPYFGDDDKEDIVSQLVELGGDAEERMRMAEFGAKYREEERFAIVDKVLKLLAKNDPNLFAELRLLDDIEANEDLTESIQSDIQTLKSIHASIAEFARVRVERVRERHIVCFGKNDDSNGSQAKPNTSDEMDNGHDAIVKSSPRKRGTSSKKNSETAIPTSYENVMDSYRNLLCRRCFTYDCNLHGNLPKPNLELLGELAVLKEKEGHWDESNKGIDLVTLLSEEQSDKANTPIELTPIQKSICERAFLIFQGDTRMIAKAIGSSSPAVAAYAKEKGMKLRPPRFVTQENLPKKKREKYDYKSMKSYNAKWLNRIISMEIHPAFIPCDHDEPCNEATCSCVKNGFFCTKHCGWGCKSRNFFRGCACKAGQCRSNSCPCYAAKRECDPDLCRACGACTDPPNQRADTGQRCRNDSISMRRHAHLLRAESTVKDAGWGVYTKHALKKGDFVHEYVGEMISQEEAERRGIIYDKMNMSYLFNLTSDFVVDASRKGNKTRYINHSSKPNCEPKMIRVNGDIRIGLFAKEEIDAQSELFFDYRYDDHMENDLIVKPAYDVDWMKNPKMANKISKRKNA